jgi:hypothetical protein
MNTKENQRKEKMSFSLWALACEGILPAKGLPQRLLGQARMHPQSKGDPVLGLHSCRALSPVPRPEHDAASQTCHQQT